MMDQVNKTQVKLKAVDKLKISQMTKMKEKLAKMILLNNINLVFKECSDKKYTAAELKQLITNSNSK